MKKLFALSVLVPSLAFGQSLVGTNAELRTGLLEDFTGIHCGYCPDGHAIMASIAAANPGRVSLVGIHAGVFANPANGSEPDSARRRVIRSTPSTASTATRPG